MTEKEVFKKALKRVWKHSDYPNVRVIERGCKLILNTWNDMEWLEFSFDNDELVDIDEL